MHYIKRRNLPFYSIDKSAILKSKLALENMPKCNNHVIIMAGGSGQRFWPWSTQALPKQFCDFLGIGKTLLQATAERFTKIVPQSHIWVVTQERYAAIVKNQLPWIKPQQVLC